MKNFIAVRTDFLEFALDENAKNTIFKIFKTDSEKINRFKKNNLNNDKIIENQQEYIGVYQVDNEESEILEEFNLIGYVKDVKDEGILNTQELLNISEKPLKATCVTARFFDTEEHLIPHLLFEVEISNSTETEKHQYDNYSIEIKNSIERVVNENILTYEECIDRYNTCKNYDIFEIDIIDIFNSMRKYDRDCLPVVKPKVLYLGKSVMRKLVSVLNLGEHLAFYGLASTGKNTCVDTISWLYNRPMRTISCHSQIDVEIFFGKDTLKNSSSDNTFSINTEFVKGQVIKAMEKGEFLILDEANTLNQSIVPSLNSVLDYRGQVEIPDIGAAYSDENFRTIITFNKDFQGTVQIQEAFSSRFYHKHFDWLNSIEEILIANIPNYNIEKVHLVDRVYKNLLQNVTSTDIKNSIEPTSFSIRGLIRACKILCYRPYDDRESLIEDLADECNDPDDKVKIIAAIDNAIELTN